MAPSPRFVLALAQEKSLEQLDKESNFTLRDELQLIAASDSSWRARS
jgi:hypothetical protein